MDETLDRLLERLGSSYGPGGAQAVHVRCPGRTEICGNHTDHEGGQVVAGAIDRYVDGVFRPSGRDEIRLLSEGYPETVVALGELEPRADELNTTAALVRGLAAGFAARGNEPAGFDAVVSSAVPVGSGLSSSAAFEVEVAEAMNALWAAGQLAPSELALMSQASERDFFGKPSGLMDQASVALGGIQHMDFSDPETLAAEGLDFDFSEHGYAVVLVAVGAGHEDLTDCYAAVPLEMQAVARELGCERLGQADEAALMGRVGELRRSCGDRAVLRAIHYFREERLVGMRAAAMRDADMARFLELERLSGASSAMYLQNVSTWGGEQPAMVALALADELLGEDGCARIHGGGFGGTIQCFVPLGRVEAFVASMDRALGEGSCGVYAIDHEGVRSEWL